MQTAEQGIVPQKKMEGDVALKQATTSTTNHFHLFEHGQSWDTEPTKKMV